MVTMKATFLFAARVLAATSLAALPAAARPNPAAFTPQVTAGTPPADSGNGLDPRRVGVRAFGSYWGGAGEQIDTTSGNVNFSIPLMTLQGRGGWTIPIVLSYNSQMWRMDSGGTWLMGADVGYGLGWRLQAGSITPVWANVSQIDHYIFADATGAEYNLSVNNNGVWSSLEGTYAVYDSNANELHQPDGSFWVMGCTSAGGEADSGTMYPTTIEDANGNQITIYYATGAGGGGPNTSARILLILDARGGGWYLPLMLDGVTYQFTYNSDPIPHLTQITNAIGTAEQYTFSPLNGKPLYSPIDGSAQGTTTLLEGIAVTGMGVGHSFTYGTGGEMSSLTTPLGGTLGWTYGTPTYEGTIQIREVRGRTMVPVSGGSTYSWSFGYNTSSDGSQGFHQSTTLTDLGANTQKVYTPAVAVSGLSLVMPIAYEEHNSNGSVPLHKDYTWTQDGNGAAYMGSVKTTLDLGTSYAAVTTTTQILDTYGNVLKSTVYDYNQSTPTKTYNMTYVTDPNYTSIYIRNRLSQATVTTSTGTVTVAQRGYDDGPDTSGGYSWPITNPNYTCGALQNQYGLNQHDSNYNVNFLYRGNLTWSNNNGDINCYAYQITGVPYLAQNGAGTTINTTPSSSTNYALPGVLSPNGNSNLATSVGYASSFAVTSVAGPNGATATTTYDTYGRPQKSTIPDGAETDYTYTYIPNVQTATITTNGATQWEKTTLDGFGRTISVQTGYGSTTVNEVDTQYAPCACSPLGKMWRVSQPYAPGGGQAWTTYAYDGSGRTVTVTKPDGASTTTYTYQGNLTTVTDQAGKWKTFTNDAFGNLVTVSEPDPDPNNPSHTAITNYTYNAVNQLVGVSMQRYTGPGTTYTQTRSFGWTGQDMTSATNPEDGTVTYQYDGAHHVTQRTDALGTANSVLLRQLRPVDECAALGDERHPVWSTARISGPARSGRELLLRSGARRHKRIHREHLGAPGRSAVPYSGRLVVPNAVFLQLQHGRAGAGAGVRGGRADAGYHIHVGQSGQDDGDRVPGTGHHDVFLAGLPVYLRWGGTVERHNGAELLVRRLL